MCDLINNYFISIPQSKQGKDMNHRKELILNIKPIMNPASLLAAVHPALNLACFEPKTFG